MLCWGGSETHRVAYVAGLPWCKIGFRVTEVCASVCAVRRADKASRAACTCARVRVISDVKRESRERRTACRVGGRRGGRGPRDGRALVRS